MVFLVLGFLLPTLVQADTWKFKFRYESRSTVDSTRKDYAIVTYPDLLTFLPVTVPQSYDKTFISTENDLTFSLRGDLTEDQFLDFRETLHYQSFRPEDYSAYSMNSFKYKYLDHLFNLAYGISLGESDVLTLDYYNGIYRLPIDPIWEYTSHMAKGRFNHQINRDTSLGMQGTYEEREYINDHPSDYQEGAMTIDFSAFLPERVRYQAVSSSARGDRGTFEKTPTGMNTRRVVDHYTTWTKKPGVEEPEAKFLSRVTRGDMYLTLTGDVRSRKRNKIDNGYAQSGGTLRTNWDVNDNTRFTLEDVYYQRDFEHESDVYFLYDHWTNKLVMSARYQPEPRYSFIFTVSDEFYKHAKQIDQDYRLDYLLFETYYAYGHSAASLYLKGTRMTYRTPRLYYADNDQIQAILGYDYPITRTFLLHLKDEWVDTDYDEFEDLLYSSYVRNTWRIALEKQLSPEQGLEIGYQSKREWHHTFTANDIVEKSLFLSWLSHF